MAPASGPYRVYDLDSGETIDEGTFHVEANAAAPVRQIRISQGRARMLVVEWEAGGRKCFNHYALGFPPVALEQYHVWLQKLNRRFYRIKELF